jgi:hypothetical protein
MSTTQAAAAAGFENCAALHGPTCTGKCEPNKGANTDCIKSDTAKTFNGWVGCCEMTAGNWKCLNLIDWACKGREPKADRDKCAGQPAGGSVWFGGNRTWVDDRCRTRTRGYLCTEYEEVSGPYGTEGACADACKKTITDGRTTQDNPVCNNWCTKECEWTWSTGTKKWTTADTCTGDRNNCMCSYPPADGTTNGQKMKTKCKALGSRD